MSKIWTRGVLEDNQYKFKTELHSNLIANKVKVIIEHCKFTRITHIWRDYTQNCHLLFVMPTAIVYRTLYSYGTCTEHCV